MSIDASDEVKALAAKGKTKIEGTSPVTNETFKENYPTRNWVGRFYDALNWR